MLISHKYRLAIFYTVNVYRERFTTYVLTKIIKADSSSPATGLLKTPNDISE